MRNLKRNSPTRSRMKRLAPLLLLILAGGPAPLLHAQGASAAGVSLEAGPIPVNATFTEGGDGVGISVRGAYDLPDDASVMVYFSNAIEYTPLQQKPAVFKGGRYSLLLGPFPALAPGNYLVRAAFTPWEQSPGVLDLLKQKKKDSLAKGQAIVAYRTSVDVRSQVSSNLTWVNTQVREIRDLFIELERKVPEYRAQYDRTHDAEAAQRWHEDWRTRATSVQGRLHEALKGTGFGAPFKQQNESLLWVANRLVYYGTRYAVRIVGDEKLAPGDEDKTMEDLAKEDHLPSGMIRTQFFRSLGALRNLVAYDDPNRADATRARPLLLKAFALLTKTYDAMRRKAAEPDAKPPTRTEWESALAPYRKARADAEERCQNILIFTNKRGNRRADASAADVDAASALLQVRDLLDSLATALGQALVDKKGVDEVPRRIEAVVTSTFRPPLAEVLGDLRMIWQDAVGNFSTAAHPEVRDRTPYLDVLAGLGRERIAPVRATLGALQETLTPLDPASDVVQHYSAEIDRGKALCDLIEGFVTDVLKSLDQYRKTTHPAFLSIDAAMGEFEKNLTPPPRKEPPR